MLSLTPALYYQAHQDLGNKWADIAKLLPGRTDNSVKNHWNSAKRRLTRMPSIEETPSADLAPGEAEAAPTSSLKKVKFPLKQLTVTDGSAPSLKKMKFMQKHATSADTCESATDEVSCSSGVLKEKVLKTAKKAGKRKAEEASPSVVEYPLEEWRQPPKKSPRKQAAVSKVNQFLCVVAPWKEGGGGQKGFVTPPLPLSAADAQAETPKVATTSSAAAFEHAELPEDHEVADVLLKLLSPVNAIVGEGGGEGQRERAGFVDGKLLTFPAISVPASSPSKEPKASPVKQQQRIVESVTPFHSSDDMDGEMTELCVRHSPYVTYTRTQPVDVPKDPHTNHAPAKMVGMKERERECVKSEEVSKNVRVDSKGLLNHFRSLSALADLATTELSSPIPSPQHTDTSHCLLQPRPSAPVVTVTGFSRLSTSLQIVTETETKTLFVEVDPGSPLTSTHSLSSSDGHWSLGLSSRSNSRLSGETSTSAESPLSVSPDLYAREFCGSGSGSDSCIGSIVSTGSFELGDGRHCAVKEKAKEGSILALLS